MRDISLHLLDLMENSLRAGASLVQLALDLDAAGALSITLTDDGCGMDEELLQKAADPFTTSRTTRKVGLGIPLTKLNAERTGGTFSLQSAPGQGTRLTACFQTRHMDCLPLGDLAATIVSVLIAHPQGTDILLTLRSPAGEESFDTRTVRQALGEEVPLSEPEVVAWLRDTLNEQTRTVLGGETT